jgi:regulatory protein
MDAPAARSELERALDLGRRAVDRRDRTISELRTLLERKRVGPGAIEATVAELCAEGLLDDARYARRFTEDKRELARWGSERIARDLHRRGIRPDLIEAAVAEQGPEAELGTAVVLLEQRFGAPPHDDRERDRAWRLLVRRGYSPEIAYDAVREYERSTAAADSSRAA